MKIGTRVMTKHGIGTVKGKEQFSHRENDYRVAVKHDIPPKGFEHFKNNLLYYFLREVEVIK